MAALVNLYLLPPAGLAGALPALAGAWLDGGHLALPAIACAPLREPPAVPGLRTPQGAALLDAARRRDVASPAALRAELERAAREPLLLAFACPGAAGAPPGCAVGLYAFPAGHRLRLVGEAGEGTLLDEPLQAWVHLQGEGAPGEAAFLASPAGRAALAAWPGARAVRLDWA